MLVKKPKVLVVGAGPTGAAAARDLADKGVRVLVIDRRNHIAGNCYDYYHDGVLTHKYGPHYFHTNDTGLLHWLNRFTEWLYASPYHVKAFVDGRLCTMPPGKAEYLGPDYRRIKFDADRFDLIEPWMLSLENESQCADTTIQAMAVQVGRKFYHGYTRKQWGNRVKDIDLVELYKRVPLRQVGHFTDKRYFLDRYQQMPKHGYTAMFKRILDHPNIKVMLQVEAKELDLESFKFVVFTGAIDEYYGYQFGELKYRTVDFNFESYPHEDFVQPCVQINYPNDYDFTRTVEVKHVTGQRCEGTVVVTETPREWNRTVDRDEGRFYPIPFREDHPEREKVDYYKSLSIQPGHVLVGRLAQYEYINMDQAFIRGITAANKIIIQQGGAA